MISVRRTARQGGHRASGISKPSVARRSRLALTESARSAARALGDVLRRLSVPSGSHNAVQPAAQIGTNSTPPANAYGDLLAEETRLKDVSFYTTDPSWARISHESQAAILNEGHRLAQVSLWETSRQYMPELQNRVWPEGPWMIKLGDGDIRYNAFGDGMPGMKSNDIDVVSARQAIIDVAELRNKAYHPGEPWGQQQALQIDNLLVRAQRMAVLLHDRKNALRIRALRDDMQDEVARNYREIVVAYVALRKDPQRCLPHRNAKQRARGEWAMHHQRLFFNTLDNQFDVPEPIFAVAKVWNQGGHPLSEGFPTSGFITKRDDYTRIPGQDDDYFRRLNRPSWNVDTPVFREIIRSLGASRKMSNMTARAMRHGVEEGIPLGTFEATNWKTQDEQTERRRIAAERAGLFNHASAPAGGGTDGRGNNFDTLDPATASLSKRADTV